MDIGVMEGDGVTDQELLRVLRVMGIAVNQGLDQKAVPDTNDLVGGLEVVLGDGLLEVAALARTSKEDIDQAWNAIKHAAKPRIHTFIATSDIHLEHKLKMTRNEVLQASIDAVRYVCLNLLTTNRSGKYFIA